jgi:predicted N-formylglutamate amidohydrolase
MSVLITVPHAVCQESEYAHQCDYASSHCAQVLDLSLTKKVRTLTVIGDVWRPILDLNRIESRSSPFRQKITRLLKSGDVSLLLDIHSYPVYYSDFGDAEITLLDDNVTRNSFELYSVSLLSLLRSEGISVNLLRGANNDIQIEAKELGVKALLIEFREDLPSRGSRLKQICDVISEWAVREVSASK